MANPREKFQTLLRKLFQFDCAELDFGIYRIMNQKRDVIEKFIEKDLLDGVAKALESGALGKESGLAQELAALSAQIKETLSDEALDAEGNLAKEHHKTKLGKQYLELRERASSARSSTELESEIFNHLYSFFSRYYDEGDFMSLRRYSKRDKYAIPYNGEEVHLHWANADQYYIKTGENFTDYSYKHGGWTIHFKLRNASVEQNNVKGAKRFFIPRVADVAIDKKTCALTVPFEYRPLVSTEEAQYGVKLVQDKILDEAYPMILAAGKANSDALAALLHEKRKDSEGKPVTLLEHHLSTYTRINSSDFFIHKDLKEFLEKELDFYLKNEILNLDEVEAGGEARSPRWFQMMTAIKAIGRKIIAFLSQIEDFQKRVFEKRKFVTEADYCITLDRIPEALYPEILKNKAQIDEWGTLFNIEDKPTKTSHLKAQPHLVLDTKNFNSEFKDSLLAFLDGLDSRLDGVLIKSDNYQALNLLREKYRQQIRCVYIDPPYNAQSSEIIYKNSYKHSSWLSLMQNRIECSKPLLLMPFVYIIAIDEVENMRLSLMLSNLFNSCEDACISIVHNPTGQQGDNFSFTHEFAHFVYPSNATCIGLENRDDPLRESEPDIRPLRNVSSGKDHLRTSAANCFYPIFVKGGKIIGFGDVCDDDFHPTSINIAKHNGIIEVYPIDPSGVESKWVFARDTVETINDELTAEYDQKKKSWDIIRKKTKFRYKSLWEDKRYSANSWGSVVLNNILPGNPFTYPKSIYTVRDCIDAGMNNSQDGVVLDYFAGSGTTAHAVINLNREDKGSRKYILVEVGEYFDTVLKPRIEKVIYSEDWKNGKPISRKGSSHAFKYLHLESYEDALDNIAFQTPDKQDMFKLDDYVLSYMLDFETKQSETLLNVAKLDSPFDYKLKRHGKDKPLPVDLPETFNYLIGLHVESRRVYENKGTRYLVYCGKAEGKQTVVIWRTTSGWDKKEFEQDRDFVLKEKLTDGAEDVFVNTDSFIPGARSLDPVFKHRMFNEE